MKKTKVILVVIVAVTSLSLVPAVKDTYEIGRCADGLILHVATSSDATGLNPWHPEFLFMSRNFSERILRKYDWPYQCRTLPGTDSLVNLLVSESWPNSGNLAREERLRRILQHLIDRGEPVDGYNPEGYTPLLNAMLVADQDTIHLLLSGGADPEKPIVRKGSELDGLDAFEFSEWLVENGNEPEAHLKIRQTFEQLASTRQNDAHSGEGQ